MPRSKKAACCTIRAKVAFRRIFERHLCVAMFVHGHMENTFLYTSLCQLYHRRDVALDDICATTRSRGTKKKQSLRYMITDIQISRKLWRLRAALAVWISAVSSKIHAHWCLKYSGSCLQNDSHVPLYRRRLLVRTHCIVAADLLPSTIRRIHENQFRRMWVAVLRGTQM